MKKPRKNQDRLFADVQNDLFACLSVTLSVDVILNVDVTLSEAKGPS